MTDKRCEWCGKPIIRREDESPGAYEARRYCCKACAAKDRPKPARKHQTPIVVSDNLYRSRT